MVRSWLAVVVLAGCGFSATAGGGQASDVDASPLDGTTPDSAVPLRDATAPDAPAVATTTMHGPAADTWLHSGQPTTSFAGDTWIIPDGSPQAVGLMRFDLSSLAGTVIQSVELHVWTDFDPAGGAVNIYPLLEAWAESAATWNQRDTNVAWSAAGAAPPARGTDAIGTFTPTAAYTEYTVTLDTATVAGWVAAPATNFGITFHTTNDNGPKLNSRDATSSRRPFLRITHVP